MKILPTRHSGKGWLASVLLALPAVALAAPGEIAQVPLIVPAKVQPNLFFMLDDSVSMASEVLPDPESDVLLQTGANNLIDVGILDREIALGNLSLSSILTSAGDVTSALADPGVQKQLTNVCVGHNLLAFDARKTYTPWFGDDDAGQPYTNQSVTAARKNPYLSAGDVEDLRGHIVVSPESDCTGISPTELYAVNQLSAAQQANYANWYSYYRKREYVMKRALSEVIWKSPFRVGLASLNNKDGIDTPGVSIGIEVADVDWQNASLTVAERSAREAARDARLQQLFRLDPAPGLLLEEVLKTVDLAQLLDDLLGENLLTDLLTEMVVRQLEDLLGGANSLLVNTLETVLTMPLIDFVRNNADGGIVSLLTTLNTALDTVRQILNPLGALGLPLGPIVNVPTINVTDTVEDVVIGALTSELLSQLGLAELLFDAGQRGTPLRTGLNNVRLYFEGNAPAGMFGVPLSTPNPILPAADGGECQQNVEMLLSDGVWNGRTGPGNGNADGNNDTDFDGGTYGDGFTDTLADTAMVAYEYDLRPDLANKVPQDASKDDLNKAQKLLTHVVAFGLRGSTTGTNWSNPDPSPPLGALLTDPTGTGLVDLLPLGQLLNLLGGTLDVLGDQLTIVDRVGALVDQVDPATTRVRVDDMRHAAYNGRGAFNSAFNAEEIISSLEQLDVDLRDRLGTLAPVGVNASNALDDDLKLFEVAFDSSFWSGVLTARELNKSTATDGGIVLSIGSEAWAAHELLAERNLVSNPRNILTWNGSTGLRFRWTPSADPSGPQLSDAQKLDLLYGLTATQLSNSSAVRARGEAMVAYLRGDHSNEQANGGSFRDRGGSRLGDIVHSSAVFVGKPNAGYPDTIEGFTPAAELNGGADPKRYSTFIAAHKNRTPAVYVGANDGMLHAFNGNTGEEMFAYIPGMLASNAEQAGLHYLANPGYRHRYYVDNTPTVTDAYVNGQWRSILVGTTGAGGAGVFALDVTEPGSSFAPGNVLWEVSSSSPGFSDLGSTFSKPVITRLQNGKWAAIFGNGYNNTSSGRAKLYIVYLDGSNLTSPITLDTTTGSVVNNDCLDAASDCNGLSTPNVVDVNADGNADRVYAGDVQGNVWVFEDAGSGASSDWRVARSGNALFQALDANGNRQPITSRPSVLRHPQRSEYSSLPNLLVYVGTGQFVTEADPTTSSADSFYAIWDTGSGSKLMRGNLVQQSFTDTGDQRFASENAVVYTENGGNGVFGWYFDLGSSLERFIADSTVRDERIYFNSFTPSVEVCDFTGTGYLMVVDAVDGRAVKQDIFRQGLTGAALDNQAVGTAAPALPSESVFLGDNRITALGDGGDANVTSVAPPGVNPPGRQSWRDLELRQ